MNNLNKRAVQIEIEYKRNTLIEYERRQTAKTPALTKTSEPSRIRKWLCMQPDSIRKWYDAFFTCEAKVPAPPRPLGITDSVYFTTPISTKGQIGYITGDDGAGNWIAETADGSQYVIPKTDKIKKV